MKKEFANRIHLMKEGETTSLREEINRCAKYVSSESQGISISELSNMYINGEINIQPEYQRYFKWTISQKSKFIESLFLDILSPTIFFCSDDNNIWEVFDGLQRLSTIFQFMGILKDENGDLLPPLVLESGVYLKELNGASWDNIEKPLKLEFKTTRINIEVLKSLPSLDYKYEIFERLNSGGTFLNAQELLNVRILRHNKYLFDSLTEIRNNFDIFYQLIDESFKKDQYDFRLILLSLLSFHYELDNLSLDNFINSNINYYLSYSKDEIDKDIVKFKSLIIFFYTKYGVGIFRNNNIEFSIEKYCIPFDMQNTGMTYDDLMNQFIEISKSITKEDIDNWANKYKEKFMESREERIEKIKDYLDLISDLIIDDEEIDVSNGYDTMVISKSDRGAIHFFGDDSYECSSYNKNCRKLNK